MARNPPPPHNRKPPRPHSSNGPLTDDELYDEVACRDVPLSPETEAWQKKFIEDWKKENGGGDKPA